MLTQDRPPPIFLGDDTALDFLNSVAVPRATEFEWLESGPDLLDWLVASGLCSEDELCHLRKDAFTADIEQAARDIREFRDSFRAFIQTVSGHPNLLAEHQMIGTINSLLGSGAQYIQIDQAPDISAQAKPLILTSKHQLQSALDLLPRIAAACAYLICNADFRYVRNCEGSGCTMYFQDVSKNHRRRWCSMDVCGNRAKAAAHRKHKKR
ncbi:MAG: CGNR zinc finger domain-containing protein [Marinosulfonomonas sp.]|nr:CGNR zinc finger domain-containing protein [Marinosulfonomonas sp.]